MILNSLSSPQTLLKQIQNQFELFKQTPIRPAGLKRSLSMDNSHSEDSDDEELRSERNSSSPIDDCLVCGDKSSGKHYGKPTCEGCKSFFKRSVRRKLIYKCKGKEDCPVDPQHRNQCQFCRFDKCIRIGMKKEAVQQGRRSFLTSVDGNSSCNSGMISHLIISLTEGSDRNGTGSIDLPSLIKILTANPGLAVSLYHSQLIAFLIRAEPQFGKISGFNKTIQFPSDPISELGYKVLFGIVEWVRNVPFFPDLLLPDQVTLLHNHWPSIFLITSVLHNIPQKLATIGLRWNNSDVQMNLVSSEDPMKLFQKHIEKFKILNLDNVELGCLKSLCLFNPDTPGLKDVAAVDNVQSKILLALEEYERYQSGNFSRCGKLLLRLPSLSQTNTQLLENLFFTNLIGSERKVESLIRDMLLYGPPPSQVACSLNAPWPHWLINILEVGASVPQTEKNKKDNK